MQEEINIKILFTLPVDNCLSVKKEHTTSPISQKARRMVFIHEVGVQFSYRMRGIFLSMILFLPHAQEKVISVQRIYGNPALVDITKRIAYRKEQSEVVGSTPTHEK